MRPRTKRQHQILAYITNFIAEHGYEPSYQQIANSLGLKSKGGVAKHIASLEKMGLLEKKIENGRFHLKLITEKAVEDLVCVIEWFENPSHYNKHEKELLFVPKLLLGFLPSNNMRAITVMDNGMLDANICEDDIALVENKSFVRDGEVIAVLIKKEEIVLRKYYRVGSKIELVPMNETYDSILVSADQIGIIGIYRSSIRPYM